MILDSYLTHDGPGALLKQVVLQLRGFCRKAQPSALRQLNPIVVEESFNIEVAAMRGGNAGEGDNVEASRDGSEDPGLRVQDAASSGGFVTVVGVQGFSLIRHNCQFVTGVRLPEAGER